ncbi:ABC transporter permease [Martelella soudanensis]|uniref:ABC transporter permease n=1 Tax=unclassified Martelella TaxID=2629616 RepID=UPI0015E03A48|nr:MULTISPECIES: iron ABC transporter permease [unclassified Martelella]
MSNSTEDMMSAVPSGGILNGTGAWLQATIAVLAFVLIGVAMAPAFVQLFLDKPLYYPDAVFTLTNLSRIFTDPEVVRTYGTTLVFTVIVVVLSMLLGTCFAILLGRTDLPGKAPLTAILLWPLFLSPQVIGFGAILSYGPSGIVTIFVRDFLGLPVWDLYTVVGMAVITAIASAPVTTLYCIVAARQQDPNHDAAARMAGAKPWRILTKVTLPLMRPALVFALIMNVVHALETLSIPLIIGGPANIKLMTTLIYEKAFETSGIPEYGLVSALAVSMIGLVAILFGLQRLVLQREYRFVSIGSRVGGAKPLELGVWKWPAFGLVWTYVIFAILFLLGAVFLRSFAFLLSPYVPFFDVVTLQNYADILTVEVYKRSIINTIILALVGAGLGTALIAAVALVAQRSNFPLRRFVDGLAQMPRVLPGLIVGLGVFYASVYVPMLSWMRNTIWLLLLAYLIRFMSAGYGIVLPALFQITTDFDRAAKAAGAGWTRTMARIVLPLQKQALLSCFVLLMILIVKEYSAAVFLMSPGSEVIGTTMLSLWIQGQTGPVAALAVLQILLTGALITVASRLFGVKLHD